MLELFGAVAGWVLNLVGKKADADTERARIDAGVDIEEIKGKVAVAGMARDVAALAMGHRIFWWVWGGFAVPLACWWALAIAGTVHGLADFVPAVDVLNSAVKPYADRIFDLVFYTGAGMAGAQTVARAISR